MPDWRFVVARHFGGRWQRQTTCARIKAAVEQRGASSILPLVRYEIGRAGEYYLGLAVNLPDADDKVVPDIARDVLASAGVPVNQLIWPVDPALVTSLLRGALDCESFTIPIAYEAQEEDPAPATDRIFAEIDVGELSSIAPDAKATERYDRLLYWCSAIGSGDLGRIKYASQLLGISDEWGSAWSVLRRLVLLGHIEFDGGKAMRWGIIPPTAITTADGKHQVLVGQRTPRLLEGLHAVHPFEQRPQTGGPPILLVDPGADQFEYRAGRHVRFVGDVSHRMSELLPALPEWVCRLPVWQERDFARFETQQYDPYRDEFRDISPVAGTPPGGLYRFVFDQGPQRMVTVAYRAVEQDRWICGDYYGLRYLARSRCRLCRAIYRSDAQQLLVPASDRWPMPYERALVLASGALPQRVQPEGGPALLSYEGATPELSARLSALLGLEVEGVA